MIAAILFWLGLARADVGIPVGMVVWSIARLLLVSVVLVEAIVAQEFRPDPRRLEARPERYPAGDGVSVLNAVAAVAVAQDEIERVLIVLVLPAKDARRSRGVILIETRDLYIPSAAIVPPVTMPVDGELPRGGHLPGNTIHWPRPSAAAHKVSGTGVRPSIVLLSGLLRSLAVRASLPS